VKSGPTWDSYVARRDWIKGLLVQILKEELVGAEIGVWRGYFINNLLSVEPRIKMIYAIDNVFSEEVINRIVRPWRKRVGIVWGSSEEVSGDVPSGLDFIHIDGGHGYEQVTSDLTLYEPKIVSGGLVCGHDYYGLPSEHVKQAVDEYAASNKRELHSIDGNIKSWWWFMP
jgi:hypothetical protein